MRWLTRSIVPSVAALAALIAFFPRSGPAIRLRAIDFRFVPQDLIVHTGDSVLVENRGRRTHTFTCRACGIDTGNVQPAQGDVVKFGRAGTFPFVCTYHAEQGMTGRVIVLEPGQATPPPEPSPTPEPTPAFEFTPSG